MNPVLLLRDRPRPGRDVLALFMGAWALLVAFGLIALRGAWGLPATAGWVGLGTAIVIAHWVTLTRCEYVLTDTELIVYYGPGAPERFELGQFASLHRQSRYPLRLAWRRFRANRFRDGIELRTRNTRGSWWIAPTDTEGFFATLASAMRQAEARNRGCDPSASS